MYYNSVVVIGRDGRLVPSLANYTSYRKMFPVLWGKQRSWGERGMRPSEIGVQAWDLDFGRIAVLTCFDVNFPEIWHEADALGAEMVFWPSTMSVDFEELSAYAITHRYNIVACGRPGASLDIAGATVSGKANCTALCQTEATIDLDRTAVFGHDGYNDACDKVQKMAAEHPGAIVYERPGCDLDERGVPASPKPIDHGSNVMLLRANRTGVSVRALLRQYGIETAREYKLRSRRGLNSLRSAGMPVPGDPP